MRDRSFNSWMQRVLFQNYEDWHMKEPNYNRNGFHIIGIDNTLKAIQDGYIPYMELTPPQAIQGCTRMKVTVNKKKDCVDLHLDVDGRFYMIPELAYPEAVQILRNFVRSLKLPEASRYIEVQRVDGKAIQADFRELALLLLGDSERTKRFLKKHKPDSLEAAEDARNALYEEMLEQRRAVELEWKCDNPRRRFARCARRHRRLVSGAECTVEQLLPCGARYVQRDAWRISAEKGTL